jgi:hypothetical protein
MQKRSSKDINQTAFSVVQQVTGQIPPPQPEKNPHAQALGRLGGLKGGKARAEKLNKSQRSQIASKAATIRWAKKG